MPDIYSTSFDGGLPIRAAIKPHQYSMRARLWANAREAHHRIEISPRRPPPPPPRRGHCAAARGRRSSAAACAGDCRSSAGSVFHRNVRWRPSFKRRLGFRPEDGSITALSLERGNSSPRRPNRGTPKGPGNIRTPSVEIASRRSTQLCGGQSFETWSKPSSTGTSRSKIDSSTVSFCDSGRISWIVAG